MPKLSEMNSANVKIISQPKPAENSSAVAKEEPKPPITLKLSQVDPKKIKVVDTEASLLKKASGSPQWQPKELFTPKQIDDFKRTNVPFNVKTGEYLVPSTGLSLMQMNDAVGDVYDVASGSRATRGKIYDLGFSKDKAAENPNNITGREAAVSIGLSQKASPQWIPKGFFTPEQIDNFKKTNVPFNVKTQEYLAPSGPSPADLGGVAINQFADPAGLFGGTVIKGGIALAEKTAGVSKAIANSRAVKAATGQNISALRKITGTTAQSAGDITKIEQQINRVGKDLRESGVIKFGDRVENIAPRIVAKKKEVGAKIGEIGAKIDEIMPGAISGKNIADDMVAYAAEIPETVSGLRLQERILAEAANLEKMGDMSFAKAQEIKNQFKHKAVDADALISSADSVNAMNRIVGKHMDDTAAYIAMHADDTAKELINEYGNLKGQYRSLKLAGDASSDRVLKNLSNRFVSPSDYFSGGTLATISALTGGNNITAVATAIVGTAANKIIRERGSATAAVILGSIANKLEKSAEFGKKYSQYFVDAGGPEKLLLIHQTLLKNSLYRKEFEEKQENKSKENNPPRGFVLPDSKPGFKLPKKDKGH